MITRENDLMNEQVTLTVNGQEHTALVAPRTLLSQLLRDTLNLTGTHVGCDTSSCGACTVLVNGKATKSCTIFAVQAQDANVITVEGLANSGEYHPIQQAFREKHGLQCGFCTPGMMITAVQILQRNPNPSENEIRSGLRGNLCRCTGYHNIVKAVQYAAEISGGK